MIHNERIKRFRERRTFGFRDGRRFGRRYLIRVFLLAAAAILLTWYAKLGVSNPFAVIRSIRIYGDGGGYTVAALAAEFRKDTVVIGELTVSGGAIGGLPSADSSGAAVWKAVYPYADSGAGAVLLAYGGATALICGAAVYASPGGVPVPAQFREKLDLLVVPPSSDEELLGVRNRFRPRFVAVAAPCLNAPAPNILCAQPGETGRWSREFTVKGGKLEPNGDNRY